MCKESEIPATSSIMCAGHAGHRDFQSEMLHHPKADYEFTSITSRYDFMIGIQLQIDFLTGTQTHLRWLPSSNIISESLLF